MPTGYVRVPKSDGSQTLVPDDGVPIRSRCSTSARPGHPVLIASARVVSPEPEALVRMARRLFQRAAMPASIP